MFDVCIYKSDLLTRGFELWDLSGWLESPLRAVFIIVLSCFEHTHYKKQAHDRLMRWMISRHYCLSIKNFLLIATWIPECQKISDVLTQRDLIYPFYTDLISPFLVAHRYSFSKTGAILMRKFNQTLADCTPRYDYVFFLTDKIRLQTFLIISLGFQIIWYLYSSEINLYVLNKWPGSTSKGQQDGGQPSGKGVLCIFELARPSFRKRRGAKPNGNYSLLCLFN